VIKRIAERYNAGYSPIVVVCGKMRVGKTTKAYLFANWLSQMIFKKKWDWENNTIISLDQVIEKLESKNPEIMVMDEVQRMLSKKDFMKSESRLFSKLMTSQAYKHYILILILPRACDLGQDHIANVNYVIPVHTRKMCYPYRLETNNWDISLKSKPPKKFPLSHFDLDVKNPVIKMAFKDELAQLEEFKHHIEVNLKENILQEVKDRRGLSKPIQIEKVEPVEVFQ
jgi:hypothetical protein